MYQVSVVLLQRPVNVPSVSCPATATSKRSHFAKGLADDLIKQYEKNRNL